MALLISCLRSFLLGMPQVLLMVSAKSSPAASLLRGYVQFNEGDLLHILLGIDQRGDAWHGVFGDEDGMVGVGLAVHSAWVAARLMWVMMCWLPCCCTWMSQGAYFLFFLSLAWMVSGSWL